MQGTIHKKTIQEIHEKALFESKIRIDGEELQCFDHHKYIVWTTSIWMNKLFTASYDCTVSYITFDMTSQTKFSQPEIIEGPDDWGDAFGADSKGNEITKRHKIDIFHEVHQFRQVWHFYLVFDYFIAGDSRSVACHQIHHWLDVISFGLPLPLYYGSRCTSWKA